MISLSAETYIKVTYFLTIRDIIAFHTHHVVCFYFAHEWRNLKFNAFSKRRIREAFHGNFIRF